MSAASSSAAPWEIRAALRAAAEQAEHADSDSGSCTSDGDEPISAEGAGDLMVDYLMELLTHRRPVSARIVCTICWWASKAGAKGLVESFALDPTCQTGKFQAHLDKVSGVSLREDDSVRYHVPTALNEKRDACRAVHEHPVNVPHEVANDEILASLGILQDVRRRQWPEVFYSHPIVQKFPGECVLFALFIDGVPSTRRDGMLGVGYTTLRHLLAMLLQYTGSLRYAAADALGGARSTRYGFFSLGAFLRWLQRNSRAEDMTNGHGKLQTQCGQLWRILRWLSEGCFSRSREIGLNSLPR